MIFRDVIKTFVKIFVIGIAVFVGALLGFYVLLQYLCSRDLPRFPQTVDIAPLANLRLTQDVKTVLSGIPYDEVEIAEGKWAKSGRPTDDGTKELVKREYIWWKTRDLAESSITVHFRVYYTVEQARSFFNRDTLVSERAMTSGGEGDNRYVISNVEQYRSDPEGCCRLMESFGSCVAFQHRNLIIYIGESTKNKDSKRKDKVIRQVSEDLRKLELTPDK